MPGAALDGEQHPGGEIVTFLLAAGGTAEPATHLRPGGEQHHDWVWKVQLTANLVSCPYCGAHPCRPCRTLTGRIPGRICDLHYDRHRAAGACLKHGRLLPGKAPRMTAKPPEEPAPFAGFEPYDDAARYQAWLHVWCRTWLSAPPAVLAPGSRAAPWPGAVPAGSPASMSPGRKRSGASQQTSGWKTLRRCWRQAGSMPLSAWPARLKPYLAVNLTGRQRGLARLARGGRGPDAIAVVPARPGSRNRGAGAPEDRFSVA